MLLVQKEIGSFVQADTLKCNRRRYLIRKYLMYYLSVSVARLSNVSAYLSDFSPYGTIRCDQRSICSARGKGVEPFVKQRLSRLPMVPPVGAEF